MAVSKRISLFFLLWFVSELAHANPLGLSLMRTHAPEYVPGMPVEIVVTVEAASTTGLKAMGVYETLPEGWRFEGVSAGENGLPAIMPMPGDGPQLEFAWITPPVLPCSFSYRVMPSEDSWGVKEIHGLLEYRLEEGPYYLPETVTVLVGPEETAPSLELRGDQVMEVMQGDIWAEPGYTALDARQQDISSRVVITGEVVTDMSGTYTLRYSVASASGEKVTEAVRIVRVLPSESQAPSESSASSVSSLSRMLPEQEPPKAPKGMDRLAQTVQKGEQQNTGEGTARNKKHLPHGTVLPSSTDDNQETDGEALEMQQERAPMEHGVTEKPENELQQPQKILGGEPIPNGKSANQKILLKQASESRKDYGSWIIGLAGIAGLGIIVGGCFVYKLGGGRRPR